MLQKLRVLVYALGFRPNFRSVLYSYQLEVQDQWRTGKR